MNVQALVDAATAPGAGRFFTAGNGDLSYDRVLFTDFLRQVLLYENLAVVSSRTNNHRDIDELGELLNQSVGAEFMTLHPPDSDGDDLLGFEDDVMVRLCLLIRERESDGLEARVKGLHIPAIYKADVHQDGDRIKRAARQTGMNRRLIPFALWCFRGLLYADVGARLSDRRQGPTVYVASPGRLSALQKILPHDSQDAYVAAAYADLLDLLRLPEHGYRFARPRLPPGVMEAAAVVSLRSPAQAVAWAIEQRRTEGGVRLRAAWAEHLAAIGDPSLAGVTNKSQVTHMAIGVVNNMEIRSISIGANARIEAPVVVADSIENSFNRIEQAPLDEDLATLLTALGQAVTAVAGTTSGADATALVQDFESLTTVATAPEPRSERIRSRLRDLCESATVLGAAAAPVLEVAAKLSAFFGD